MATTYIESQGVELQVGDGGDPTETFALIPQVITINGPDGSASEIDVTTLDSTAREFAMGLADEGNIPFELVYDPDNTVHAGLRADRAARTLRNFQLVLTNNPATTFALSGYVTQFALTAGVDDVVRVSANIRISGPMTEV